MGTFDNNDNYDSYPSYPSSPPPLGKPNRVHPGLPADSLNRLRRSLFQEGNGNNEGNMHVAARNE